MDKSNKTLLSKLFAKTLASMGLDEDKVKEAVKSMDKELEDDKTVLAKDSPADIVPADPYLNKTTDDEDDDKEKEVKVDKAKDAVVHGITVDEVGKMIKDAISEYSKECESNKKGMDEALNFANKFGINVVCDSANDVYDSILTKSGIEFKGCSLDEKKGMVKILNISAKDNNGYKNRNIVVGDSNSVGKSELDYLTPDLKSLLGVK